MTEHLSATQKMDQISAGIADTVQDLLREAKPMMHQATDRMSDRVNDMAHKGIEAVRRGQQELANAEQDMAYRASQMIRNEPFKAMLIAAGVGAAAVALVGLMTRSHPEHPAG